MTEPAYGDTRSTGLLVYVFTRCPRCTEGWWRVKAARARLCRRCRSNRPNPFE